MLKYDEALLNLAFNFNWRRYTEAEDDDGERYCRICLEPVSDADLDTGDTGDRVATALG